MLSTKKLLTLVLGLALVSGMTSLSACGKKGDPYASKPAVSGKPDAKPEVVDNSRQYPADYQDEPEKKKFLGLF